MKYVVHYITLSYIKFFANVSSIVIQNVCNQDVTYSAYISMTCHVKDFFTNTMPLAIKGFPPIKSYDPLIM